ncbi:MAG: dynamin family protein [Clostridiales bacterium]|jgi:predicted GTPase|nr:dynamin family protein [Clostridiales bacterium]
MKAKEVYIKYNPYTLVTEVRIDGAAVKANSELYIPIETRFQQWVEDLPRRLKAECNTSSFNMTFHGTTPDYEDLREVLDEASKEGFQFKHTHVAAKKTASKEKLIRDIFQKIRNGPIEELKRDDAMMDAFKKADNNEFEVSVVATMSAGKSTLINAMLGRKLMPSKREACTAKITRIKDNDAPVFTAKAYNEDGIHLQSHKQLNLEIMKKLNEDPAVSDIKVAGDIPFVDSERDMTLILVDTPGPNCSRNLNHQKVQRKMLDKSSKTLILYVINATQLGVNDDSELLRYVSESMKVNGKQSKDRFIFVVNQLDEFRKGEDDVKSSLNNVRDYLKERGGIENPNIYPAAARPALLIRMACGGEGLSHEEDKGEFVSKVRQLNCNDMLHLENDAPLPPSLRKEIDDMLAEARQGSNGEAEALIHTGVVSIELAIRQYVRKYAKTAKIKNVVDTLIHYLDETQYNERLKKKLAESVDEHNSIAKQLKALRAKIDGVGETNAFEDALKTQIKAVWDTANRNVTGIGTRYSAQIRDKIEEYNGIEIKKYEFSDVMREFEKFCGSLLTNLQVELERVSEEILEKECRALMDEYKKKVDAFANELSVEDFGAFEPLRLIQADFLAILSINWDSLVQTRISSYKEEKSQESKVAHTATGVGIGFAIGGPVGALFGGIVGWLFGATEDKSVETVKYINGSQLAEKLAPLEEYFADQVKSARKHMEDHYEKNVLALNSNFHRLDDLLKAKIAQLESYATDKVRAEERIRESRRNEEWINDIKSKIAEILEI